MKKKLIIAILVILASASLFGLFEAFGVTHFISSSKSPSNTNKSGLTPDQQQSTSKVDADNKKSLIEDNKPGSDNSNPGTNVNTPQIDLSAQSETNGTVTVFTKLYNIGNGTCNLIVQNGSQQKTQSADVMYQPEYSTCAGFSISKNGLGSGTWLITLSVVSNGQKYDKSINYVVQ